MSAGRSTRDRLLDAGERLFAERGITNVSVAEITAAAGQKNGAAIHYHFGGRDGLLDAIIDRHQEALDRERRTRLDALDAAGSPSRLRDLVAIIVEPMVARLGDESGQAFLKIQAARAAAAGGIIERPSPAMAQLRRRLEPCLPELPTDHRRERGRLASLTVVTRLGQRADEERHGVRRPSRATLTAVLIDAVEAVLAAPAPRGDPGTLDR